MERTSGSRRAAIGLMIVALVTAVFVQTAGADAAGNSDAAHQCQKDGWKSLLDANGDAFRNVGDCVSFAARGGQFFVGTYKDGLFVIPTGHTATMTNATWYWGRLGCADDHLAYGYQLGNDPKVQIAEKPAFLHNACNVPIAGFTVGPFNTTMTLRVYLEDWGLTAGACDITFFSEPGPHVAMTGSNPYDIGIKDSAVCTSGPNDANFWGAPMQGPQDGNWRGTLTIS